MNKINKILYKSIFLIIQKKILKIKLIMLFQYLKLPYKKKREINVFFKFNNLKQSFSKLLFYFFYIIFI